MTTNMDSFEYQGPDRVYKPNIDDVKQIGRKLPKSQNPSSGYHNMDYLNDMLKLIDVMSRQIFSFAEKLLAKYSVKVDTADADLKKAHDLIYPADTTPGYITFDEYKYLLTLGESNAVSMLKSFYENEMREAKGNAALDILLIARTIHAETVRIKAFIENYIGDLDETAEFRTIELFQDWSEQSISILEHLKKTVETEVTKSIPRSELAKITPEVSAQYQSFFQIQLNNINNLIKDNMTKLDRNWSIPSASFYDKTLGPGLLFQHKTAKVLTDPANLSQRKMPLLSQELKATMNGIATNFTMALKDQMQRNQNFYHYVRGVLENIDQRDTYKNYINQLEVKGKKVPSPFVDSSSVDQSDDVLNAPHPLEHTLQSLKASTSMFPSHDDLGDREKLEAHPQYMPKVGGKFEGDVTLEPGVRFDGMVPSLHRHNGSDGTQRIRGEDLEFGTIAEENLNPNATTSVPTNLALSKVSGSFANRVTVEVQFEVQSTGGIVNYEFECIKL